MDNVVSLERFARRDVTHRLTDDDRKNMDLDASLLSEIVMWAQVGLEIARVRPVAPATRAKALEIQSIIRDFPRATNG
jgi:hypothetical protein